MHKTEAAELVRQAETHGLLARVLPPRDRCAVGYVVAIDSDVMRDGRSWYHTSATLVDYKIRELVSDGIGKP